MAMVQSSVEYRDIKGYPGYRVGNDGSVWSRKNARWGLGETWKRLGPRKESNWYPRVSLHHNRKVAAKYIHSVVLEAFIGPCPKGMEACHGNGNPNDNRLSNLRWDTKKGNMADCIKHGRTTKGEANKHAKLTEEKVREIRRLCAANLYTQQEVAGMMNVSQSTISLVSRRTIWSHVA